MGKVALNNLVDLRGAESYAGRIEYAIRAAMEEQLFRGGVDGDKVAMCPDA
jgi:hypothetical protein